MADADGTEKADADGADEPDGNGADTVDADGAERADANRANKSDPDAETIAVTFHPQEWVDSPGESHDWDRRQLIPARERDAATYHVPRADATDETGNPYSDESYEANLLAEHPSAPGWITEWDGPYYVTVTEP